MSESTWGGARQGQPGTSYSNRTDLAVDRAPTGPNVQPVEGVKAQKRVTAVEDTPFLTDPGNPAVPMTAGIPSGPGIGAPNVPRDDLDIIRKYLPDLKAAAKADGAPTTFRALVRYLEGS